MSINGTPIPPSSYVAAYPEDIIECEIFVSDWGTESFCGDSSDNVSDRCISDDDCENGQCDEFRVRGYQADVALTPAEATGTRELLNMPSVATLVAEGAGSYADVLQSDFWRPQRFCSRAIPCPLGYHCLFFPRLLAQRMSRLGVCRSDGLSDNPVALSYIDITRPDFILRGVREFIVAVDTHDPVRFLGLTFYTEDAVWDRGLPLYLGTLFVKAGQVGGNEMDPCGPRELSFAPYPDDPCIGSALMGQWETDEFLLICEPHLESLTIEILCPQLDGPSRSRTSVRKKTTLSGR
ncbi:MAG: hypothetical protein IIC01_00025 [Planctomycetes bacterium]|nr:hypothetical protein [Planctomycetota bacterium]